MQAISVLFVTLLILGRLAAESPRSAPTPVKADGRRFHVSQSETGWWLIAPDGRKFIEKGVGVVTQGDSRQDSDPDNPSYGAWRNHQTPAEWAAEATHRLQDWGFDAAAGWADYAELRQVPESRLFFTPVLHLGAAAGAPWWDMWDERNLKRMQESAREQILSWNGDSRVIGYFSDNELGWWNATLWKMTLEQPSSSGQRQRLVQLLERVYDRDWARLQSDFEPENARNWKELRQSGMLYLKPGGNGIRVMRRFLGILAERYYGLMKELIRRSDPKALFLGDRYPSFYYPEVITAAGHHVDAVSSNLNAHWRDGTFLRSYMDGLNRLSGRPIWISEFYAAATENRSGNRNDYGVYPVRLTQAERSATARTTLVNLAHLPYVIAADWFQYFDEPRHGREDGENFNFGLVDIDNQPYETLITEFRECHPEQQRLSPNTSRPDCRSGIPPAPYNPLDGFSTGNPLLDWNREAGFVPLTNGSAIADLYAAWKPEGLYLGIYSLEIIETAYYRKASVPKVDRPLWSIRIPGNAPISFRIGAGREPIGNQPDLHLVNRSGLGHDVVNVAAIEIPSAWYQKHAFQSGESVELDVSLMTHARAAEAHWRGRFRLSP